MKIWPYSGQNNEDQTSAYTEMKDHFCEYVSRAHREQVLVTRHGRVAGVLIGFKSEEDWFDYQLENDPRFLRRVGQARKSLRSGQSVPLEKIPT
jgi:prevent-host-death family protein